MTQVTAKRLHVQSCADTWVDFLTLLLIHIHFLCKDLSSDFLGRDLMHASYVCTLGAIRKEMV